jgi:ribosomal protein S18 acetylase RimI-like enzyme
MAEVVTWRSEYRDAFERLNREWIERYFVVEPGDEAVFGDPAAAIVLPGGEIFFVRDDQGVQGTCALIPHGPGVFELAKMAVATTARGRGYGDMLMRAAIAHARRAGAHRIMLVSNTRLAPALALYRKFGFTDVPLEPGIEYARADIQLQLDLR